MVASSKIKLNVAPKNYNHCGAEWKTHGSCCEEQSALAYNRKDLALLTSATSIVSTAIANQIHIMSQIVDKMKGWIKYDKKLSWLQGFIDNASKGLGDIAKVGYNHHQECWMNEIGSLRSSSLCSTCSSNSKNFFFQDKALISFATCQKMLNKCSPSFGQIILAIRLACEMVKAIHGLNGKKVLDQVELTIPQSFVALFNELRNLDIYRRLNEYQLSINNQQKDRKASLTLCEMFISLHREPFIILIMDMMHKLSDALLVFYGQLEPSNAEIVIHFNKKEIEKVHPANIARDKVTEMKFKVLGESAKAQKKVTEMIKKHRRDISTALDQFNRTKQGSPSRRLGRSFSNYEPRKLQLSPNGYMNLFIPEISVFEIIKLDASSTVALKLQCTPMNMSLTFP